MPGENHIRAEHPITLFPAREQAFLRRGIPAALGILNPQPSDDKPALSPIGGEEGRND